MFKNLLTTTSIIVALLLFDGCGGGGGTDTTAESNTSLDEQTETPLTNNTPSVTESELLAKITEAQKEPYYKYSWHIESANSALNDAGYTIDSQADINVTEAWKYSMGGNVKVAVIDDGADTEHEDLKSNIILTYNADDKSNSINISTESHGNTCAGFIVAPINGKGIVGIAPDAKLIAIRLEGNSDADTIDAFEYAKQQGAKVISCSWGTENVSDALVAELKTLYDAGITVLFASGNDGKTLDTVSLNDESEVEWVIGVGASGENNDVTSYSNYGENIEVIASGGDTELSSGLLGLDNTGSNGSAKQLDLVNNNYAFADGTSFATPITAGVVALMYGVNPNLTPAQIKTILTATATKIGKESGASYNADGFDVKRAYGKINAGKAVSEAQNLLN